jgi:small subunit ribosomal protein S8
MSHTDPIADMLTRIRNGLMVEKLQVAVPVSKIKMEVAKLLKDEGYIKGFKLDDSTFPGQILVDLKYDGKTPVIDGIKRISKPGRRVYADVENIPVVLGGLGVAFVSTSKGIMTGKSCKKNNVGGEVLLYVW